MMWVGGGGWVHMMWVVSDLSCTLCPDSKSCSKSEAAEGGALAVECCPLPVCTLVL